MRERVQAEIDLVKNQHPNVQHGPDLNWVLIPEYNLPPGRFTKAKTQLLFLIPVGYPNTGPDDFFVDGDLQLKGGGAPPGFNPNPNSSSGVAPVPGNWGWFSWHPQQWGPAALIECGDNLLTFLRGVNMCLKGEEAT